MWRPITLIVIAAMLAVWLGTIYFIWVVIWPSLRLRRSAVHIFGVARPPTVGRSMPVDYEKRPTPDST